MSIPQEEISDKMLCPSCCSDEKTVSRKIQLSDTNLLIVMQSNTRKVSTQLEFQSSHRSEANQAVGVRTLPAIRVLYLACLKIRESSGEMDLIRSSTFVRYLSGLSTFDGLRWSGFERQAKRHVEKERPQASMNIED